MKILYAIGAFGPRYLANEINGELVHEFARRGHECLVFAGVTPSELGGEPVSYDDGPIHVRRQLCDAQGLRKAPAEIGQRIFRYGRFLPLLRGLRKLLAVNPDVDVIHAEAVYPIATIAAIAGIRHRAALVPSIQGGDLINYPGYGYARFALPRLLIRWTFGRSAMVRANSGLMIRQAQGLGCPEVKLREVVINIADRFFDDDASLAARRTAARLEVCRRHGFPAGAPLVVSVGRLLPLKGFHDLVAATAELSRKRPDVRVLIAGPNFVDARAGDQRQALQTAAARLAVQEQVRVLDALHHEADLPTYLAAADLVVAVAHIEGMNKVVPEAASLGVPAIVSRATGVAPLVQAMDAGVVVEARDVSGLAAAMTRLIENPGERQRLGQNALGMSRRFKTSVVADQLLDLYSSATGPRRSGAR